MRVALNLSENYNDSIYGAPNLSENYNDSIYDAVLAASVSSLNAPLELYVRLN